MAGQLDTQQIHASISRLLGDATKQVALFLEGLLPSLFDDWRNQTVVNKLTPEYEMEPQDG
jgi:ATP-dependent helicase HepA